jgi:hypothetical protein
VPPVVHDVLRSPGQPLASTVRAAMEPRFASDFSQVRLQAPSAPQSELTINEPGDALEQEAERIASAVARDSSAHPEAGPRRDFSQVRLHIDQRSAEAASALNSRAFTLGNHVVFGAGQYSPATPSGKELLAHELTHVIQQGGAQSGRIARAPLDLRRLDQELFFGDPLTQTSGEIGKSATCKVGGKTPPELPIEAFVYPRNTGEGPGQGAKAGPSGGSLPTGGSGTTAEKPTAEPPPAAKEWPPPSPRKTTNHPDRSDWRRRPSGHLAPAKRAVIVGGIHGDERGPLDLAKGLKAKLDAGAPRDFDTIFIPVMNPGGVNAKPNPKRENLCGVDLNRNFPGLTSSPALESGKAVPAEQPETKAVREVIEKINPSRILALHAHGTPAHAGAFGDPSSDPKVAELACRMAVRMQGKPGAGKRNINVAGSKLDLGFCNALYPDQKKVDATTENSSLGVWASGKAREGGRGIPVITHEVSGKSELPAKGERSVEAILPGLEEFLLDNEHLPSEAGEILAHSVSDAFLTGESKPTDEDVKVRAEIQSRVAKDFARLQSSYTTWLAAEPARKTKLGKAGAGSLTNKSDFRSFTKQSGIVSTELGKRKITNKSTDQQIKDAILDIMTTMSMPGFSRHAWGTEIDVIDPTAKRWKPGGNLEDAIPFLAREAPKFGFFHPYSDAGKRPAPHYEDEPWHISYWRIADVLQAEWVRRISGAELDKLIQRTAAAIGGGIDKKRMAAILKSITLEGFQKNVAASPGKGSGTGVGP